MPERKCEYCKKYIDTEFFILNYQCRKCKTIEDIQNFLSYAKLSKHFNISIEYVKYILTTVDIDDDNLNKYNEFMLELKKNNFYSNSQFINKEVISKYLDE